MGGRFWVSGQNTAARALAHHGGLGVGSVVFDEATRAEGVRDSARGRAKDLRKGSSKTHLFNPDAGTSLQFSSPASPPSPAGAGQKYSPPWEGLSRGFRRAQTLAHPKNPSRARSRDPRATANGVVTHPTSTHVSTAARTADSLIRRPKRRVFQKAGGCARGPERRRFESLVPPPYPPNFMNKVPSSLNAGSLALPIPYKGQGSKSGSEHLTLTSTPRP